VGGPSVRPRLTSALTQGGAKPALPPAWAAPATSAVAEATTASARVIVVWVEQII
jgi:hypothetical protein